MSKSGKSSDSAAALITAAGRGSRMGHGLKKELRLIDGVPVIRRCVNAFLETNRFEQIVITFTPGQREEMEAALAGIAGKTELVEGGDTRQESVYNGLQFLLAHSPNAVLIHDGARPWVRSSLILAVLEGTVKYGACIPVTPVVDAPKQIGPDGRIIEHIDKKSLTGAQTPQGFRFGEIVRAHEAARSNGNDFSDDAEAYHHTIGPVFTVNGDTSNRKITYGNDI